MGSINRIAVIVPVFNRRETTLAFLRQVYAVNAAGVEEKIVVIDDGSTDGTTAAIKECYKSVTVLQGDGNLWWTGAVNMGVRYALESIEGVDAVLIINDDLKLDQEFLANLLQVANINTNALVSSVTINQDTGSKEEVLTAGFIRQGRWLNIRPLHSGEQYTDRWGDVAEGELLTGASLLIPVAVIKDIGLFDDKGFPHNWGDFEYTLRANCRGYKCLVAMKSKVYTEFNPKYPILYFYNSTRFEYFRNLFDNRKYFYGFSAIRKSSFMHVPMFVGVLVYSRRLAALIKQIIFKLFLPKCVLQRYIITVLRKKGGPDYVMQQIMSDF